MGNYNTRKLTPVSTVPPGTEFGYCREPYQRATEEEELRHTARDLAAARGAMMAYHLTRHGGRTPVTFLADTQVVIEKGGQP